MPVSSLGFQTGESRARNRAPPALKETPQTVPIPERFIIRFNLAMFVFHTTLLVTTLSVGRWDLNVPVYKTKLELVRYNVTDSFELIPRYEEDGYLALTLLTALFFALSAVAHLANATVARKFYLEELRNCRTPTRWIEYFFSAPVMILIIAYSLGVRNRSELVAIAALVAITMPFGYWTEVIARPKSLEQWTEPLYVRLYPFFLGNVPQSVAWALIFVQFYDGAELSKVPWFVFIILWVEFLLFSSFGIAAVVAQIGPPKRFYLGEVLFQSLSLISKGTLGGVLITNVLFLSRFDDIF